MVERMEALHREPTRKDLRWQLGIDDDLLDTKVRQREVKNWIEQLVIPAAGKR
jgi:GMP synthase (glutamine-hydrolysing)